MQAAHWQGRSAMMSSSNFANVMVKCVNATIDIFAAAFLPSSVSQFAIAVSVIFNNSAVLIAILMNGNRRFDFSLIGWFFGGLVGVVSFADGHHVAVDSVAGSPAFVIFDDFPE